MKIDKVKINSLINRWMQSDKKLQSGLSKLHIKVLHQRLVEELSFAQMAKHYKSTLKNVKSVFCNALERVRNFIGSSIHNLLATIHNQLELKEAGKHLKQGKYDYNTIFLN